MALPIGALFMFVILHILQLFHKRCILGQKKNLNDHLPMLIGTSLTMFYFLYIYLTRVSLDVFNCNPPEPSDGFTYMEAAPSIQCGSSLHGKLLIGSICSTIVYALGYPFVVACVLFSKRESVKHDQLLRAMKTGESQLTNPNCFNFRRTFHKIYYHFKPACYYWTLLIVARKFFIAFAALMFRNNPSFQLSIALLVLFIAYALQVRHNPYMAPKQFSKVIEEYEMKANAGDEYAMKLITEAREAASGNASKHVLTKKKDLGVYIFDYNQVEAILLASGILVTLSGIMFQSQYLDDSKYDAQREILTMSVLGIILASITYYCVVFVSEVWGTCRAKTRRRRKLNKREKIEGAMQLMREFELHNGKNGGQLSMNPMFSAQREDLQKRAAITGPNASKEHLSDQATQEIKKFEQSNAELLKQNEVLALQAKKLQEQCDVSRAAVGLPKVKRAQRRRDSVLAGMAQSFRRKRSAKVARAGSKKRFEVGKKKK
eukprot:TRINITY_DN2018_c0_g3_i1.p1 TRINITY_DN2018_c0_g3~~TRINITY_DN2018_c0_g3_i1.p1  ORF type:complete len:561 (-),score=131.93 TRINITY_DN2018_c0_g3_i1:1006-2472(-)